MGEQINVTLPVVAAFVLFASAMMFVLFFVLNKWIFYIFLAIFAYGSFTATVVCLRAAMGAAAPRTRKCLLTLPRLNIDVAPRDLVACAAAAALLIAWLADRHAAWAWVPQDALGVFFMVMIAQVITLPDGRVATAFLLALFCYDVFMVFITPLFMPRGDSVMVHVARGGSTNEVRRRSPWCRLPHGMHATITDTLPSGSTGVYAGSAVCPHHAVQRDQANVSGGVVVPDRPVRSPRGGRGLCRDRWR